MIQEIMGFYLNNDHLTKMSHLTSLQSSLQELWAVDGLKVRSGNNQADTFQFQLKLEDQLNQNVT